MTLARSVQESLQASTQKKQQPPPQNQTLNKDSYKDVSKRLLTDSRYTSLPPEKKALVRGRLYDKYVAPFYKGLSPNARETFSKAGTQDVSKINTASDLGRGTNDFFTHLAVTTGKQGIKLERGMDAAASRLGDVIYGVLESTGKGSLAAQAGDKFKTWMDRETQAGQKYYDKKEDEANSYLGQKFADNLTYKIAEAPIKVAGSAVADAASHPEWFIAGEGLSSLADGLLGKGALTEALNTGTTAQKMGYRAIKGAADGLVMGAYEGERGEDLAFTGTIFGELEAAGPLAGDAAKLMKPTAEKSIDFLSKLLVWGGPKRVGQALNAATSMTKEQIEALPKGKLSTQIIRATDKVLDNVGQQTRHNIRDASGRFVSNKQVASGVGALIQQANKEAAVHNPELVAAQVSKEVREAGQHPVGAEIQQYLKTQGIDLVKENTTKTVKNAAINAGIYKGIKTKINKEAASTVTKMLEGIGPGAASKTEKDVFKSLLGIVESHIPFESKDHTITQLWGMRKELPREVHPALIEAMKIIWGPSIKKWDAVAKRLETHMEKMEATGHITPSDMRGVFHSTKLSGQKTGWQKQLDDEFKAVSAAKKTRIDNIPWKEGARRITDPNANNYPMAIKLARAIAEDGEAGAKQEVERELGNKKYSDWKNEYIKEFKAPAGQVVQELTTLVQHVKNAPAKNMGTLYRGMESFKQLKTGQTFKFPFSSFTKDIETAKIHGSTMFRVSGPIKAIDVSEVSHLPQEGEIFSTGQFVVDKISNNIIDIHQVN